MPSEASLATRPVIPKPPGGFPEISIPGELIESCMMRLVVANTHSFESSEAQRLRKLLESTFRIETRLKEISEKKNILWADGALCLHGNTEQFRKMKDQFEERGNLWSGYETRAINDQGLLKPQLVKQEPGSLLTLIDRNHQRLLFSLTLEYPDPILYDRTLSTGVRDIDNELYLQSVEAVRQRVWEQEEKLATSEYNIASRWVRIIEQHQDTINNRERVNIFEVIRDISQQKPISEQQLELVLLADKPSSIGLVMYSPKNIQLISLVRQDFIENLIQYDCKEAIVKRFAEGDIFQYMNDEVARYDVHSLQEYMLLSSDQRQNYAAYLLLASYSGVSVSVSGSLPDHVVEQVLHQANISNIPAHDIHTIFQMIAQRVQFQGRSEYMDIQERNISDAQTYLHEALNRSHQLTLPVFTQAHRRIMHELGGGGRWRRSNISAGIDRFGSGDSVFDLPRDIRRLIVMFNDIVAQPETSVDGRYQQVANFIGRYNMIHPPPDGAGRHSHVLANGLLRLLGLPDFNVPRDQYSEYVLAVEYAIPDPMAFINHLVDTQHLVDLMKKHATGPIPVDNPSQPQVKDDLVEMDRGRSQLPWRPIQTLFDRLIHRRK